MKLTKTRVIAAMKAAASELYDFDLFEGLDLRPHVEVIDGKVRVLSALCGVGGCDVATINFWAAVDGQLEAKGISAFCEDENNSVTWVRPL